MTAGIAELCFVGPHTKYLTGRPMVTAFAYVKRNHTNFSMSVTRDDFPPSHGTRGQTVRINHSTNGDILTGLVLQATLPVVPTHARWCEQVEYYLYEHVDVLIDGRVLDRHSGDWMAVWNQLSSGGQDVRDEQRDQSGHNTKSCHGVTLRHSGERETVVYTPLQFWFCNSLNFGLPTVAFGRDTHIAVRVVQRALDKLLACRDAEEEGNVDTETLATYAEPPAEASLVLWSEFALLDTLERRFFARHQHEYVVDYIQEQAFTVDAVAGSVKEHRCVLDTFHGPLRALAWVARYKGAEQAGVAQWNNYTTAPAPALWNTEVGIDGFDNVEALLRSDTEHVVRNSLTSRPRKGLPIVEQASLTLNGVVRVPWLHASYFNGINPNKTDGLRIPESRGINVYSFAKSMKPGVPSGFCQVTGLHAVLHTRLRSPTGTHCTNEALYKVHDPTLRATVYVFGVTHGLFRIAQGLCGFVEKFSHS